MWAGAMEKFGYGEVKLNVCLSNNIAIGLPTLHLGIPGRPPLPYRPFPPLPSFPLPPSRPPWASPLNQLGGLGERCKIPQWVWGKAPANKRFGGCIYLSQKEQL